MDCRLGIYDEGLGNVGFWATVHKNMSDSVAHLFLILDLLQILPVG